MSLALADEITEEALAKCRSRGPNDESRDCHYRHPGLRVHLRPMRSVVAQVFGRRDADTIHALLQPASKKRQGTKSREVCGQRVPRALWGFCPQFRAC